MIGVTNLCSECLGVITDPLCIPCFEKHFLIWIKEQKIHSAKKGKIKREFHYSIKIAKQLSFSETNCVICNQEMQNVCNYCVIKQASEIVFESAPELGEDPLFNYSLHDFGMYRDQELLIGGEELEDEE